MEPQMAEIQKLILVVDDEENTRLALTRLLCREGYDVMTATDGCDALNQIRTHSVDLVITDLNMPVMDGLAFLKELNREHPSSHVIMLTAYGEVESYLEALNLGAFEYLNKPVKLEELIKIIEKIFSKPTKTSGDGNESN